MAEHRSLAVIRLDRSCEALEPALAACLRGIAGVVSVHVDASRDTVQLLYDGALETVGEIHRLLVATDWWSGRSALAGKNSGGRNRSSIRAWPPARCKTPVTGNEGVG